MGANSSDDHEQQLLVGNSDDNINQQQQQQQQQHVVINSIIRFKCSFCGRGFSNAQALGGHMNVHRRDRAAKFNINNASSSSSSDTIQHDQSQLLLPWNIISPTKDQECQDQQQEEEEEQDNEIHVKQHHHKPQQLPLFVNTAVPSRLVTCKDYDHAHVIIAKTHQSPSSHGHDLAEGDDRELDLELRLGPDRPGDSTAGTMSTMSTNTGTSSTRGFF